MNKIPQSIKIGYKDYKLEWSTKKFLFGDKINVNKCKSMN